MSAREVVVVSEVKLAEVVEQTGIVLSGVRSLDNIQEEPPAAAELVGKLLGFVAEGQSLAGQLRAVVVKDQDTADFAGELLTARSAFRKRVQEFFEASKTWAYQLHKTICASEALIVSGFNNSSDLAEKNLKQRINDWLAEMELKQAQADQIAADEQRKLDDQAKENAAAAAKTFGAGEEAIQQIKDTQLPLSGVRSQALFEKPKGLARTENWHWRPEKGKNRVQALQTLVDAICKTKDKNAKLMLLGYLDFNEKALNATADKQKSAAHVPGIEFYPSRDVRPTGRGRR